MWVGTWEWTSAPVVQILRSASIIILWAVEVWLGDWNEDRGIILIELIWENKVLIGTSLGVFRNGFIPDAPEKQETASFNC